MLFLNLPILEDGLIAEASWNSESGKTSCGYNQNNLKPQLKTLSFS